MLYKAFLLLTILHSIISFLNMWHVSILSLENIDAMNLRNVFHFAHFKTLLICFPLVEQVYRSIIIIKIVFRYETFKTVYCRLVFCNCKVLFLLYMGFVAFEAITSTICKFVNVYGLLHFETDQKCTFN